MRARRVVRSRHNGGSAQAVLEMALVMPIFLLLIAYFLAVMVELQVRAQVTAATSLAAQSSLAAPVNDYTASCDYAIESFYSTLYNTASSGTAVSDSCGAAPKYATTAAESSNSGYEIFSLSGAATGPAGSIVSVDFSTAPLPHEAGAGFVCASDQGYTASAGIPVITGAGGVGAASYYSGGDYPLDLGQGTGPPVACGAAVKISFTNTALAFAVRWNASYTIQSIATPSNVRQCNPATAPAAYCPTS